jgi:hypothetical protein
MSLRRKKYPVYNRMEEKEETFYWMELLDQEVYSWYDDDFDGIYWWDYYGAPGYVGSMDEYHQMRVLTLLRKLSIGNARVIVTERGW